MKNATEKLAACEASLKRWHTRLTRASNMVTKLEKQRRRLMPVRTLADRTAEQKRDRAMPPFAQVTAATIDVAEVRRQLDAAIDTTIPQEFKRDVDVDALKAQRKSKEAPDKTKMPLTGRAAMAAIRQKRKA